METQTGPFLDFDPDPRAWLVGPTESRPFGAWLPVAVEVTLDCFAVAPDRRPQVAAVVTRILGDLASFDSPFPYVVIRWRGLDEPPVPLYLGLVDRSDADVHVPDWLAGADLAVVEEPLQEDLSAPARPRIRRSLPYSTDETGQMAVGARFLIDTGHRGAVVLAHTASFSPAEVLKAQDDILALLATITVSDEPH